MLRRQIGSIVTSTAKKLADAGVAVWLDDLSHRRIASGSLVREVAAGEIVGIATNPTILAKSISSGARYEGQLRELAFRGTANDDTLRVLTAWDVSAACDVLRPIYEKSGGRNVNAVNKIKVRLCKSVSLNLSVASTGLLTIGILVSSILLFSATVVHAANSQVQLK